eukprot:2421043-Prymnesium_polylepis.1
MGHRPSCVPVVSKIHKKKFAVGAAALDRSMRNGDGVVNELVPANARTMSMTARPEGVPAGAYVFRPREAGSMVSWAGPDT